MGEIPDYRIPKPKSHDWIVLHRFLRMKWRNQKGKADWKKKGKTDRDITKLLQDTYEAQQRA